MDFWGAVSSVRSAVESESKRLADTASRNARSGVLTAEILYLERQITNVQSEYGQAYRLLLTRADRHATVRPHSS